MASEVAAGSNEPLPLLPAFADAAQQARFMDLWMRRWNEIVAQLDTDVKTLDDDRTFQPEAMDMRGAVAEGEAMDLAHGAWFYPACKVRTASVEEMRNAQVVVVAAGPGRALEAAHASAKAASAPSLR